MSTYYPRGVCSKQIDVEIKDGRIEDIKVLGGCNGNLKGICALLKGADARETVERLKGTDCGGRGTSCPDQIARAIEAELAR